MTPDYALPTRTTTCPTCKSSGFQESILGKDRCSFCDGTEGGQGPTLEDVVPLLMEARAERDRLHADGMPRDREELQKLLNDAHRKGSQEAHEAHRLVREMGLSAQDGEVPDLDNYETRPCEPRVANEDPEDWCAIAQWESERADAWKAFAQLQARPASPHPDTVEVSAEELGILRDAFGLLRTAWNTHALYDYQTVLAEAIIQKYDALRAQAQLATEMEG